MKVYTLKEREEAKKKLPKPMYDYIGSKKLTDTYLGIGKKLNLNFREMFVISEVVNITLSGLEAESAIETNIHFVLPELSNEKTRELVADINDRIFKEARRRVQENILEPEELPPVPRSETDVELETLAEKEKEEGFIPEFEKRNQEEEARQATLIAEEEKRARERAVVDANTVQAREKPATGTIQDLRPPSAAPQVQLPSTPVTTMPSYTQNSTQSTGFSEQKITIPPTPSIAGEKLRTPTVATPKPQGGEAQNLELKEKIGEVAPKQPAVIPSRQTQTAPAQVSAESPVNSGQQEQKTTPQTPPTQQPNYKSTDPYREDPNA